MATETFVPITLPLLRQVYNPVDHCGYKTAALYETPTDFAIEEISSVHNEFNNYSHANIRYIIPKNPFFSFKVTRLNQIPKLKDLRIRCRELDRIFGFDDTNTHFHYLFCQSQKLNRECDYKVRYNLKLCSPLDATDILIIATIGRDWAKSQQNWSKETQTLMNSVCTDIIGDRIGVHEDRYEIHAIAPIYLPYFVSTETSDTESPEYKRFELETDRRIKALRERCHKIWAGRLFMHANKIMNPKSHAAALEVRARESET